MVKYFLKRYELYNKFEGSFNITNLHSIDCAKEAPSNTSFDPSKLSGCIGSIPRKVFWWADFQTAHILETDL